MHAYQITWLLLYLGPGLAPTSGKDLTRGAGITGSASEP
jgi:hypothetical protein